VEGCFVAEWLVTVAAWRGVVAMWRGKRAISAKIVTFPRVQELPEGGRLPGETVDVATPTLLERGKGVQE